MDVIGIAGTGTVAQALARSLVLAGEPVVAIAGRQWPRAEIAAAFAGGDVRPVTYGGLARAADRVLIATSDDRISAVAAELASAGFAGGAALHTSGARGPEALEPLGDAGVACGVLHPLQTIVTREFAPGGFRGIAFGVCGDAAAAAWAERLAAAVGGRALRLDAARMGAYHAGAVLASNALPALLDAAARLITRAGVGYDEALRALGPLARTAMDNVLQLGPAAALTGPVARGDITTIETHAAALAAAPAEVQGLYGAVSLNLLHLARHRGLSDATVRALATALAAVAGECHEPNPSENR